MDCDLCHGRSCCVGGITIIGLVTLWVCSPSPLTAFFVLNFFTCLFFNENKLNKGDRHFKVNHLIVIFKLQVIKATEQKGVGSCTNCNSSGIKQQCIKLCCLIQSHCSQLTILCRLLLRQGNC